MAGFTREDAQRLRASLAAMDFSAAPRDDALLARYRACYGLSFGSSGEAIVPRTGVLDSPPFQLVCHSFSLPAARQRGTAFLLHGYFDHSGLFAHLIRHCLDQGLSVIIFDMPGHGLSSGAVASIDSFTRYSEALLRCLETAAEQQVAKPWFAIGQSTGGAVLIDALLSTSLRERFAIEKYILLAPLLRPRQWRKTQFFLFFSRWLLPATRRRFSENSHDQEFLHFLRHHDALQSQVLPRDWVLAMADYQRRFARAEPSPEAVHIIQGTDDQTVDWAYNLSRFSEKFPAGKTYMVAGARHHLANESAPYRDAVFEHITQIINS